MDKQLLELAQYRIDKAQEDLEAAKLMLKNQLYAQSLNRSYYAIFHSVRAVLAFEKFDSKKHSGIIAYFNKNYIATLIFDKRYSKILMGAEKIRNKSDYNDFYIAGREDAEKQVWEAEDFIEVMKAYVETKHPKE